MREALGRGYAEYWADSQVLPELGGRTVAQAFAEGWDTYDVWRAVWHNLALPPSMR